jgi:sugar O-acyltransferase (sialic acid O-acetyltransferase NeuD family)
MLVVGAGGFAKQLLQSVLEQHDQPVFYDGVSSRRWFLNRFAVISKDDEVRTYFSETDRRFVLGIGGSRLRMSLAEKFSALGGDLISCISSKADISPSVAEIGKGISVLSHVVVEPDVVISQGCLLNIGAIVTHDSSLGHFCEVGPGALICGRCCIGDFVQIGAGAIVIPGIKIGKGSIIGAGSVVVRDIPENVMVAGNPGMIKKRLTYGI